MRHGAAAMTELALDIEESMAKAGLVAGRLTTGGVGIQDLFLRQMMENIAFLFKNCFV